MDLFISDDSGVKCYNLESEILDFNVQNESDQKFLNLTTNPLLAFQVKEVVIYLILEEKHFLKPALWRW